MICLQVSTSWQLLALLEVLFYFFFRKRSFQLDDGTGMFHFCLFYSTRNQQCLPAITDEEPVLMVQVK